MVDNFGQHGEDDIRRIIGQYDDKEMHKLYLKSEQAFKDMLNGLSKNAERSTDKSLSNTEKSLTTFLGALAEKVKSSGKTVEELNKQLAATGNIAERSIKKVAQAKIESVKSLNDAIAAGVKEFKVTKGLGSASQMLNEMGKMPDFGFKNLQSLSNVFGDLGIQLKSLIPELAAFASASAAIISFFKAFNALANEQASFKVLAGGNLAPFQAFESHVSTLSINTRRTRDEILGLGHAYYQFGGQLDNSNKGMVEGLGTMARYQALTGINDETAGKYLVTLEHMGITGDKVGDALGKFYEKMSKGHLVLEELNKAAEEGHGLWREFGGQTGITFTRFTNNLLTADSIMKSFNIDSKNATKSVQELLAQDISAGLRSTAFESAILGKSSNELYSQRLLNPANAVKNQMEAAALSVIRDTKGLALLSNEEFVKKAGGNVQGADILRQRMLQRAASMTGINPELLGQLLAEAQSKGIKPEDFKKWFETTNLTGPGGKLSGALAAAENTPEGMLKQISINVNNFVTSWTSDFLPIFNNLAAHFGITDGQIKRSKELHEAAIKAGAIGNLSQQGNVLANQGVPLFGVMAPAGPKGGANRAEKYFNAFKDAAAHAIGKFPPNIIAAALQSQAETGIPASLTLAQWALESNWGKSMPKGSNNPFGIKGGKNSKWGVVNSGTMEQGAGGLYHTSANFAKYPDLGTAFAEHAKLLASKHGPYKGTLESLKSGNLHEYVSKVGHIYATDKKYTNKIETIIHHNNLEVLDAMHTQTKHLESIAASTGGTHKAVAESAKNSKLAGVKADSNTHAQRQVHDIGLG